MSTPRLYVATFSNTVNSRCDLAELVPSADRPIEVVGWTITQTNIVSDALEVILEVTLERGITSGSGGSAMTVVDYGGRGENTSDTTGFTIRNAAHTGGTIIYSKGWNIRIPEVVFLPTEFYMYNDPSTDPITLTLSTPSPNLLSPFYGLIIWREY